MNYRPVTIRGRPSQPAGDQARATAATPSREIEAEQRHHPALADLRGGVGDPRRDSAAQTNRSDALPATPQK